MTRSRAPIGIMPERVSATVTRVMGDNGGR